jgi:isopentenyldiphosphate isomerase
MIELKYPPHAPWAVSMPAGLPPELLDSPELFPVIDEEGNVTGRTTRAVCHGGSMWLHPVVHLHIFNSDGALYLQRRSMSKDIQPGKWDTAVGGHVDYGEQIETALRREAREELALKEFSPVELFHYVWQSQREREMVCAYRTTTDAVLTPDLDEVSEGRYWTLAELQAALGTGIFTPQFEQELPRLLEAIRQK